MENTGTALTKKSSPVPTDYPAEKIQLHFPGTKEAHWKKKDGFWYHSTGHLSATRPNVTVGEGSLIGPYVSLGSVKPVTIGKNTIIGAHCCLSSPATIGDNTVIGNSCNLNDNVVVGNDVCLGEGSYVHTGVHIGNGASTIDGAYVDSHVKSASDDGVYKPRTQKARGIKSLKNKGFVTPEYNLLPIEEVTGDKVKGLVGRFVRPCPVTPRHGFVDSRPINNTEDAMALLKATREADPSAEILTMPFIKAVYSGIWTTGSLTIGPGNDGATSGHGSVRIPVQGRPHNKRWAQALRDAGITEQPYLELLWEANHQKATDLYGRPEKQPFKTLYVQLRNGPSLPSSVDFIPAVMKVKRIIAASGDLLEWESKIKDLAPGTVVYHPGGSLASHYAVHAVLNKVPILVSRKPKVGETLEPCSEVLEPNLNHIKAGFVLGCRLDCSYTAACRIMLAGCHSTSLWLGKFDVLLGLAMGCAYRLIIAAGLGEARHRKDGMGNGRTREQIYEASWNRVLHQTYRRKYIKALYIFKNLSWRGGYGGQKWFELCQWAGKMYNSLLEGNVKQALENLNGAVNAVHNGGWAFNKFINAQELNVAAVNPIVPLLDIVPLLYGYMADEATLKAAPRWWKNRTKIPIDGESAAEKEEPQLDLDNGTEDCGCLKMNCKNCFPDGAGCDCMSHDCKACCPEGCSCKDKKCHDCGICTTCCIAKVQVALDRHKASCGKSAKLGKTNHSVHLKGKKCFTCPKDVYVKFKYSSYIIPSCELHALCYLSAPMVLESEDPDSDYEAPVPAKQSAGGSGTTSSGMYFSYASVDGGPDISVSEPDVHAAIVGNNALNATLNSVYSTSKPKIAAKAVTTVTTKVQARLLNATELHIQFRKGSKGHNSYNVSIPESQLDSIKQRFNKAAHASGLSTSWATDLAAYLPLEDAGDGWWKLGSLHIKVPDSETKIVVS